MIRTISPIVEWGWAVLIVPVAVAAVWLWLVRSPGVLRFWSAIWFSVAALASFAFYDLHWRWRSCFNELGRCFDPESQVVFIEGTGGIWGMLAALSFSIAIAFWWRARRR